MIDNTWEREELAVETHEWLEESYRKGNIAISITTGTNDNDETVFMVSWSDCHASTLPENREYKVVQVEEDIFSALHELRKLAAGEELEHNVVQNKAD